MSAIHSETLQIPVTPQAKRAFEEAAARLHLSPSAYLAYLIERTKPGVDATRLDRMVEDVFGRFGPAMRKLAE